MTTSATPAMIETAVAEEVELMLARIDIAGLLAETDAEREMLVSATTTRGFNAARAYADRSATILPAIAVAAGHAAKTITDLGHAEGWLEPGHTVTYEIRGHDAPV